MVARPVWHTVVAVVALSSIVLAQTTTVTGLVHDEGDATIAGATVTLMRPDGPVLVGALTRPDGSFALEGVAPGDYTLKVESDGFEPFQRAVAIVHDVTPLRITLRIGAIEQEVTVEADSDEALSTAASDTATTRLDDEWLRDLPIASDDLLATIGGFTSPASQSADGASIVIDGVQGAQLDLPSSSISRIRVNRNPYSAIFQHPGSGRIEVSTKRGHRSRYDGGLDISDRNSVLSARNAFAESVPPLDRHTVQATLGGALPGRGASFYTSGERFVNDESVVVNAVTLEGPFVENVPTSKHKDSLFVRPQWWPSNLQTIYGTYGFSDQSFTNRGVGGFNLPEHGVDGNERTHQLTLNYGATLPPNWQNNLVVNFISAAERTGTAANEPATVVTGAFASGPSPTFTGDKRRMMTLENAATYFGRAGHRFVVGARLRADWSNVFDASNFGGVFEFSGLDAFATATPLFFRVNRGVPSVRFTTYSGSAYAQDEIRLTSQLTLTAGVRYDRESAVSDADNVAPRVALVFAPDTHKRTVLRGGAGVFYDNLPRSVTLRSLLMNGVRLRQFVVSDPAFPDPLAGGPPLSPPPPSTIRLAPEMRSPRLVHANISVEHELWPRNRLTIDYTWVRGTHLLRARNINAPPPGSARRPDPSFLNVTEVEAAAFEQSQALTLSWRGRFGELIDPYVQYVFATTTNNTSGPFALPADNYDFRPETGPADFDARHRLNLMSVIRLPYNFQSGVVLAAAGGRPYTITTGFDDNGDTVANDRPPGVTRNTARGPGTVRLDVRLARSFDVVRPSNDASRHKRDMFELRVDVLNALNRTNITNMVGVLTSPIFGSGNAAAPARTIQFSIRYGFRR